ncbi:Major Facilitator Superfamily transporter [Rivularia sp. PCC 7116]|uniref:MFS transporter n=1 Tax=Rivularia sp. PCC 7116 TaxID=373994 RepID=UPI00029F30DC|nr:MFS transporter [Rivularia sp. PCC 7116]AFY53029.1 Major Facilitator Superfamily transporter [Rivularia sp. PCC 7116]
MQSVQVNTAVLKVPESHQSAVLPSVLPLTENNLESQSKRISKSAIRKSLKASTADGVFAAVFDITTTGILLSNFLIELGATPVQIGMLSSIPMLVNLLQPLGAYFSERTDSRHSYCLWTHGAARFVWLFLAIAIGTASWGWGDLHNHQLVVLTLLIILASHVLTALGSASWLSWMAMLVPRQLRGRYFGLRNSVSSFTKLLYVPLAGLIVSLCPGGAIRGYGLVLLLGLVAGAASLACQFLKADINPQSHNYSEIKSFSRNEASDNSDNTEEDSTKAVSPTSEIANQNFSQSPSMWKDSNFLIFLAYFSLWMFAFNLSTPFFNLYMLDTLDLDVSWVTVYGSFQAGAGMLMLIFWGKLADKVGNRAILFLVGILVAVIPLLWVGIGVDSLSIWLWLPLLHILIGGSTAAIELCSNNIQISIAPVRMQSVYFATAAAVAGASGAIGTTIGGFLAENAFLGGLPGLFMMSVGFRLIALVPLLFVQEARRQSLSKMFQSFRKLQLTVSSNQ